MRIEKVPVEEEVKVFDTMDFSAECGSVGYESWGAHYESTFTGELLVNALLSAEAWGIYRISNTGRKTLTKRAKAEKVMIVNPYTAVKEIAVLLECEDGEKILLDVNHLPYTTDKNSGFERVDTIQFFTGLVMIRDTFEAQIKRMWMWENR